MKILPIEDLKAGMQIVTENKDSFEVHTIEEFDEDGFTIIDQHGYNIYPCNEETEPLFVVCENKFEYRKASAEKRENNDKPEPLVNDEP